MELSRRSNRVLNLGGVHLRGGTCLTPNVWVDISQPLPSFWVWFWLGFRASKLLGVVLGWRMVGFHLILHYSYTSLCIPDPPSIDPEVLGLHALNPKT